MDRVRILPWIALVATCCCASDHTLRAQQFSASDPNAAGSADTQFDDASLHDVVFVDREYGWAVGDHGTIWHTKDGGAHWQRQHSGTQVALAGVSFIDRENGWAVGGETRPYLHTSQATVLRTSDGGQTWQAQLALVPALEGVKFFNAKQGIAWGRGSGGEPMGVFVTDDGGRNWRAFAVGPVSAWWGGDFLDQRTGVVVGPYRQFAQLAHGDCLPIQRESPHDLHDVKFANGDTAWAVGEQGCIARSDDAGKTWQDLNVLPEDLRAAVTWNSVATHGKQIWIAGSPGTVILHSPDGGGTWQGHATGQRVPLHRIAFADESHGWAVGDLGTILHTTDGGQTWHVQRRGGERAAVLVIANNARDLPFATLAKLSGDGYRTVVHLVAEANDDPTHHARTAEALTRLSCNSVTQSSSDIPATIETEVVRQLRIWQPAVVIEPHAEHRTTLDKQIAAAITSVASNAAEAQRYPLLTEQLALPEWQVSRVFSMMGASDRGTHRIDYAGAVPQTGQTLAEVALAARSLFMSDFATLPETDEFLLKASLAGEPTASLDDLAAGLEIAHGSASRRPQLLARPFDAQAARRLAEKRRNLSNIFRMAEGNPALLAQVGQVTSDLDQSAAAALLFELAGQFRQTHQTALAADTLNLLARRFPSEPITDQALTWLVEFYASSETAHAYRTQAREMLETTAEASQTNIQQATALLEQDARAAAYAQQRFTHAVQLVEHIAQTRPLLYGEPRIRVSWAMAERSRHRPDAADRYLASLAIRYPGDEWQECGAVEQWLADRTRPAPAKPRIDCRFTTDRPNLDGFLEEKCWQHQPAQLSASDSKVTFAYDEQYLYVAIHCDKQAHLDYDPAEGNRTYDADLAEHDRVRLLVDVERDYTTYFELVVDHRGWTNDACWGDSSWNPKWFVAAGGDAEHWTAEAAIPWAELATTPPTTGAAWAVACERVLPGDSQGERVTPRDFSVLVVK